MLGPLLTSKREISLIMKMYTPTKDELDMHRRFRRNKRTRFRLQNYSVRMNDSERSLSSRTSCSLK